MAPLARLSAWSGTTRAGSTTCSVPSPPHSGQAPNGLLNENRRGSISSIEKPETGQAKRAENIIRSGSVSSFSRSASSITAMPSARASAVSKLSARRLARSGATTSRSTTTSISCFSFLSRAGASSISWNVPSILTRLKPRFIRVASSLRYSPLRPRTMGASR